MKKEDILSLNKQDNKNFDEKEKSDIVYACNKAYRIGRLLCAITIAFDGFVAKKFNYSVFSIFLLMTGVYILYMYKQFKKNRELIFGILYCLIGILLFIIYLINLFKGMYYE